MKFAVGLNLDDKFVNCIAENKSHISEVYFSWGDFPNGRQNQLMHQSLTPWEAYETRIRHLKFLSKNGIKFNLLFNAACYGDDSLSREFFYSVGDTIQYICENFGLSSVTTTSPVIAKFIKTNFDNIEVRASVNMEIGTYTGMDYLADYYDGFYMKREFNRNFDVIKKLKQKCEKNGKKLYMLANSGCLNNCSAHMFHDNLVSHEKGIAKTDNAYKFTGICKEYIKKEEKRVSLIRDTNFVRPEDIKLYEPYFDAVKLATRVSPNPSLILKSYISGHYSGNVLELLEPNHSADIYPYVLENKKISNSFLYCNKDCDNCGKCMENYINSLVRLE